MEADEVHRQGRRNTRCAGRFSVVNANSGTSVLRWVVVLACFAFGVLGKSIPRCFAEYLIFARSRRVVRCRPDNGLPSLRTTSFFFFGYYLPRLERILFAPWFRRGCTLVGGISFVGVHSEHRRSLRGRLIMTI